MSYIHTLILLATIAIISSCNSKKNNIEISELEYYHLHGNVLSAVVTLTNHDNNQNINIDTISFPVLPSELLQNKNYTLTFNKDKTIKSIISSDSLYIINNIRINDSISHMIKLENNKELRRIKKVTNNKVQYEYVDAKSNLITTSEYNVDTINKIAKGNYFHTDGKILMQKDFHYIDSRRYKRIDIKNFNSNNIEDEPIIHSFHYKYDDKKSMISCEFEDIYGKVNKCEYQYVYDEQDNWIEKVSILNGEKMSTIKRKITYYK